MFPDLLRDDIFRLETRSLWLRWPRIADAAAIVRLAGDKDVAQMTARLPHPYPQAAADRWIFESRVGNAQGSAVVLALTLKGKQNECPRELIGVIGVHETRPGRAVLGYWLGKPHWGQGLMSEAAQALTDLAFRVSDIEKIEAQVRIDNPGSRSVLVNTGFVLEGQGPVDMGERGGVFVCERFGLDRDAWHARQAAPFVAGEWLAACSF